MNKNKIIKEIINLKTLPAFKEIRDNNERWKGKFNEVEIGFGIGKDGKPTSLVIGEEHSIKAHSEVQQKIGRGNVAAIVHYHPGHFTDRYDDVNKHFSEWDLLNAVGFDKQEFVPCVVFKQEERKDVTNWVKTKKIRKELAEGKRELLADYLREKGIPFDQYADKDKKIFETYYARCAFDLPDREEIIKTYAKVADELRENVLPMPSTLLLEDSTEWERRRTFNEKIHDKALNEVKKFEKEHGIIEKKLFSHRVSEKKRGKTK